MHRSILIGLLLQHRTPFNAEAGYVARALRFVEQHPNCFDRDQWDGHVTGSVWVVNPTRDRVLLLHHGKHFQWFQPGGHADSDHDILRVALRETQEETGLAPEHIRLVNRELFDVDIHTIPAGHWRPRHRHFDMRFLVEIDDRLDIPGSHESNAVAWVDLGDVPRYNNNLSTLRMVEKTRRLPRPEVYVAQRRAG
ncbi:MAG: NUDIX hydrolase [Gammaproteobacteria bacterium]|nr:NUDIX hydrolase [Gammaproteobacteria bacterium]